MAACAPSQQAIHTAIAKTQTAWKPTPTNTNVPTQIQPTQTPTMQVSTTNTVWVEGQPTPVGMILFNDVWVQATVYIVETGFCLLSVGDIDPSVDPKTNSSCYLMGRKQEAVPPDCCWLEYNLDTLNGAVEVYCATFTLDGIFIMSDVDTVGSGIVVCHH